MRRANAPGVTRWLPFMADVRRYTRSLFRADLQAGITVALFAVPQAIAYALLAGVAPVHGLYAAMVMSIVAALWGSSPYVNTGPTNSSALLTAVALAPYAGEGDFVQTLFAFALLVGVIRLAMGLLRMGALLDFVPESAFLGFTVGAGALIAFGQLHHVLGVDPSSHPWAPARVAAVLSQWRAAQPASLCIGVGSALVMLSAHRWARQYPVALLVMAAAAVAASLLPEASAVFLVGDLAPVPRGLPTPVLPQMSPERLHSVFLAAFAVAIIGLAESASIGQALALRQGKTVDANQEFRAQGLAQIVAAFLQGMPGSGSFSRSVMVEGAGGRTRFANVYFGLVTAFVVCVMPEMLERIPVSALAGMLIYVGIRLVQPSRMARVLITSRADAGVMLLTLAVTVLYRLEYGIFVGMSVAALLHLNRTRELRLVEYIPQVDGRLQEVPYTDTGTPPHAASPVVACAVSGDLFYGVALELREQLTAIIRDQCPRHLVLRVRRAYSIDDSCWSALFDVAERFVSTGGHLYLCGVRPDFERIIDRAGMRAVLPHHCVFPATDAPFEAFDACMRQVLSRIPHSATLAAWTGYGVQGQVHSGMGDGI